MEMAMAKRSPARICGSAAGSTTFANNGAPARVPSARADHTRRVSIACAPWYDEITIGISEPITMITMRETSPAPHHSTKIRTSAAFDRIRHRQQRID